MNWKYILIVIILAVIAGAGILAYLRTIEIIEEPIIEEPEILPEEEIEIADWQIYRNEEYGFEIKYPEIIVGKEVILDDGKLIIGKKSIEYSVYSPLTFAEIKLPIRIEEDFFIDGYPIDYPGDDPLPIETVDDWIQQYEKRYYDGHGTWWGRECYKKSIAEFDGVVCERNTFSAIPVYTDLREYFFITPHGSFLLQTTVLESYSFDPIEEDRIKIPREDIESFYNIIDQMLSTFRFLE